MMGCRIGVSHTTPNKQPAIRKNILENNEQVQVGFTAAALASAHLGEEMCEGFDDVGDKVIAAVTHGTEESQENFASLQKQVSDAATATVVGFKDAQATAYQIEGRTGLDAAKNTNILSVQADKNAYELRLQAQTFASAAALSSQQIAASAAAQLAECCCELKEKITLDGDRTRALINDNEKDRLRDKVARAESMITAFYAAGKAPVSPAL